MAPEVVYGKKYDRTVDYWSLGCICYECLVGYPPFSGSTLQETWTNLYYWREILQRPSKNENGIYDKKARSVSDEAWSFITKCLTEPTSRFQSTIEIQKHPFFKRLHWNGLRKRAVPPFVPRLENQLDTSYFDDFNDEQVLDAYKDVYEKQRKAEQKAKSNGVMNGNQRQFLGFTFKYRPNARKPLVGRHREKRQLRKEKPEKKSNSTKQKDLITVSHNKGTTAIEDLDEDKRSKTKGHKTKSSRVHRLLERKGKDLYEFLL